MLNTSGPPVNQRACDWPPLPTLGNSRPPSSVKAPGDHPMRSSLVPRYLSLLTLLLTLGAPPARTDRNIPELVDWARPKVLLVYVQSAGPPRWGTGFLAERDRVITN